MLTYRARGAIPLASPKLKPLKFTSTPWPPAAIDAVWLITHKNKQKTFEGVLSISM
jgi:hypothetical protein